MPKFIVETTNHEIYRETLKIGNRIFEFYYNDPTNDDNKYRLKETQSQPANSEFADEIILDNLSSELQQQIITFFEEMVLKYA